MKECECPNGLCVHGRFHEGCKAWANRKSMSFDTSPEPDAPWKKELKKLASVLPDEYPASQIIHPNEP